MKSSAANAHHAETLDESAGQITIRDCASEKHERAIGEGDYFPARTS